MSSASSRAAEKFKTRYATFDFNDAANLDEGTMWPTAFALKELTAAEEAKIARLVKKAVSWGLSSPPGPALGGIVGGDDEHGHEDGDAVA